MMPEADVVEALNELITIAKDGQKRFLEAERLVRDTDLKLVFHRFSDDCANAAKEFEVCIVGAGGYPDNTGSTAGTIHRELMNVRGKIMPDEERTVLQECANGEDRTKEAFETLMKIDLPPAIKSVVEKQYTETLNHHQFIRSLQNHYK